MNIVLKLCYCVANFLIINGLIMIGEPKDLRFYIGSALAIIMGLILRIAIEWNNDSLSWKKSLISVIFSLCLCYLSVLFWRDYTPKVKLEYYLFFCSLFSVFIVGVLEKVFKMGFMSYFKLLVRGALAEDSKPKED